MHAGVINGHYKLTTKVIEMNLFLNFVAYFMACGRERRYYNMLPISHVYLIVCESIYIAIYEFLHRQYFTRIICMRGSIFKPVIQLGNYREIC